LVARQAVCFGLTPSDFLDSLRFPKPQDEFSPIRFRPTRLAPKRAQASVVALPVAAHDLAFFIVSAALL
jgi:hypothetical protein